MFGTLAQWFDPGYREKPEKPQKSKIEKRPPTGSTPDYRFTLANERTFLAWIRTGLALIAGGLACAQFLPALPIQHLREVLAIGLLVLGATVALRAVDHWARTERAMRLGEELPPSRFPAVLSLAVAAGAALLVVAVLIRVFR